MSKRSMFLGCLLLSSLAIGLDGCEGSRDRGIGTGGDENVFEEEAMQAGNVVKGPVSGATVEFYPLDATGTKGELLGTTTTEANGTYTVSLTPPPTSPILVEASGGSYVDEATGSTITLAASDLLTAVLPTATTQATMTPLTHMAAARAIALMEAGMSLAVAIDMANIGVAQQYNLLDILMTLPVAANDLGQVATATREQRNYGLVLGGISQHAQGLGVRAIDLSEALAEDMSDGILDGMKDGISIMVPLEAGGTTPLSASAGTADLQSAIDTFILSANNQTYLTMLSITDDPIFVGSTASDLSVFYTTTTALPPWVSGQFASTRLMATGGTPLYFWFVTAGSLPTGFSLSQKGVISGTAPALPGGVDASISPAFTVTVTDSGDPPASRDLVLRITTVQPAPNFTLLSLLPSMVGQAYSQPIADATGGTPPYSYTLETMSPPPSELTLDLDGTLRGTPLIGTEGLHTFPVCVVDTFGAISCQTAALVVCPPLGCQGDLGKPSVTIESASCSEVEEGVFVLEASGTASGPVGAVFGSSFIEVRCASWTVTQTGPEDVCGRGEQDAEITSWFSRSRTFVPLIPPPFSVDFSFEVFDSVGGDTLVKIATNFNCQ